MEYIGKRRVWISRIDAAWTLQTILFPLCLKWLKNLKNQRVYKQEKDVLTDLMKSASGSLLSSTVYFGKNRADVEAKEASLEPRKDLSLA